MGGCSHLVYHLTTFPLSLSRVSNQDNPGREDYSQKSRKISLKRGGSSREGGQQCAEKGGLPLYWWWSNIANTGSSAGVKIHQSWQEQATNQWERRGLSRSWLKQAQCFATPLIPHQSCWLKSASWCWFCNKELALDLEGSAFGTSGTSRLKLFRFPCRKWVSVAFLRKPIFLVLRLASLCSELESVDNGCAHSLGVYRKKTLACVKPE